MLYMTKPGSTYKVIILEQADIDSMLDGAPVITPDSHVVIGWTADPEWLADKLKDAGGDIVKMADFILGATERPVQPMRPPHEPKVYEIKMRPLQGE